MGNEALIKEYIRTMNNISENTCKQYEGCIKKFAAYIKKPLMEATVLEACDFLDSIRSKKGDVASDKTKNVYIFALRGFYAFLFRTKRINFNPWEEVKEYKTTKTEGVEQNKFLTEQEIKKLVKALKQNVKQQNKEDIKSEFIARRDYALYLLMLHRGFRVSEMLSLEVDQLDIDNRTICITSNKSKARNERTVGVKQKLIDILSEYMTIRESIGFGDKEYVFLSRNGKRLDVSDANRSLKKYAQLAGISEKEMHCHMLRHTAATTHLENHTVNETAKLLGHKSYNTTMIYSHSTMAQIRNSEDNKVLDAIMT